MSNDETFNSSTSEKTDPSLAGSFEAKLLSEVRERKSLYCCHDPDYNNMAKNRLEWLMIAEKCKKTVAECVKRWHSLLRIYFSSSPEIVWIHIEEFRKFEPFLTNHKLQSPSKVQRSQLLSDLWYNSFDLQKPESTPEDRQNVWLKIVSKCNAVTPGVIMSSKNWQKYWLTMKQNFGVRLYTARSTHYENSANMAETYTEEELKIIEICRATPWDPISKIISALGSNFELGTDKKSLMIKCKKCLQKKNEILYHGYCSNCCEKPIFCTICDFGGTLVQYKLSHWSKQALELLPSKIASSHEISVCSKCSDELNKQATLLWKICRVCKSNKTSNLDFLFCKTNDQLRKAFKDSTKYEFSEKDGLPGYICKMCKTQITQLNEFVKKFRRAQGKLMQIHFRNFIGDSLNVPQQQQVQNIIEPVKNLNKRFKIDTSKMTVTSTKSSGGTKVVNKNPISNEVVPVEIIPAARRPDSYKIIPESVEIPDTTIIIDEQEPAEIVIKDVFSLQGSNQQKRIQPNIVAVSQSGKIDSNNIFNRTIAVSQPLQSNPKLKNNASTVPKEFYIFPTKISKTTPSPVLQMGQPQKHFSMLPKSGPNKIINLKPTTASKPAIFTIAVNTPQASSESAVSHIVTDYETIEDAPPVFCIPKNVIKTENIPSDADKQLIDFTPSPSQLIKIEHDDDYYPEQDIPIETSFIPIFESTQQPEAPPEEHDPNQLSPLEPKNNTKIVRIKGELVTVKPHPYLSGAFVPVEYNGEQLISGIGGPIPSKLPVIRKVNTEHTVHIAKPITISQNIQSRITTILDKRQMPGIKKPRKYWGTVDEFQVAPLPVKKKPSAAPKTRVQNQNQKLYIKLIDKSDDDPSEVQIKKEIPYKDGTSDAIASYENKYLFIGSKPTKNRTLSENLNLRTSFKVKKLRINIKRDKRVQKMASQSKKLCLMQSVGESHSVVRPRVISIKYGKVQQIINKTTDSGFDQ